MQLRRFLAFGLLLMSLITFGCAGMANYQATGGPDMMGCGGDRPSDFPPYCHPSH